MRMQPNIRLLKEMAEAIANDPLAYTNASIPKATPARTSSIITKVKKLSAVSESLVAEFSIKMPVS